MGLVSWSSSNSPTCLAFSVNPSSPNSLPMAHSKDSSVASWNPMDSPTPSLSTSLPLPIASHDMGTTSIGLLWHSDSWKLDWPPWFRNNLSLGCASRSCWGNHFLASTFGGASSIAPVSHFHSTRCLRRLQVQTYVNDKHIGVYSH